MNTKNLARTRNIYTKPNEELRFQYPVYNQDGTPYNEPDLAAVEAIIKDKFGNELKKFDYSNGITHAPGTNIISYILDISDANNLPLGDYTWTVNHIRNFGDGNKNKVIFAGKFIVTDEPDECQDELSFINNSIAIVNVDGLRGELDLRAKIAYLNFDPVPIKTITVSGANFLTKPPMVIGFYTSLGNPLGKSQVVDIELLSDTEFIYTSPNYDCKTLIVIYE